MADKIVGKVSPTFEGEWTEGVKYVHPCFVSHETVMYISNGDNINQEPGVSDKWSYFFKEGGGGGASGVEFSAKNYSGWNTRTVTADSNTSIQIDWYSTENGEPTGKGTLTISVNGSRKKVEEIEQGIVTVPLQEYLTSEQNSIKLNVSDSYGNSRSITVNITVVSLLISSTFDASIMQEGDFVVWYTPYGLAEKNVYFYIDNELYETVTTTASNRQLSQTISALPYGSHKLKIYFDADLDGETVPSNVLEYEVISVHGTGSTPIIVTDFNKTSVRQYDNVLIGYQVYDPNSLTADVSISVNGVKISEQSVERTKQIYSYKANTTGNVTIVISSGLISKVLTFNVIDSGMNIIAETSGLALHLTSQGRSNNETNRDVWEDAEHNVTATLSGFNYISNGWITNDEGVTALHIANGARVTIPYKIFGNDFRRDGKTIEFEFMSNNVLNYDTIIGTCMANNKGIEITPQYISLRSEQESIKSQFKEDEMIRISFVVERVQEREIVEKDSSGNNVKVKRRYGLIHCYMNGIDSGVIMYPEGDNFQQTNPADFVFGSDDCAVDLYNIRVYNIALSAHQIVGNWIADTQDIDDMVARYRRNDIYDAYGEISIEKLPQDLPYMVLQVPDYSYLPQYKGDKKKISGYFVNPSNHSEDFEFTDVQFNVQGTSSQYYARKNYKASWKKGTVIMTSTGETVKKLPINGGIAGPVWCLKADVASSEGTNNVELVRLYNDICPYKTPYQQENPLVRQGIDGFPGLIFWKDPDGNTHFVGRQNTCSR